MPLPRRSLLPLLLSGLGADGAAATQALRLVSDELAPYVMATGPGAAEGIDVDIARQALASQGGPALSVALLPWRRALQQLERGEADLAPSVRRTPEREAFLAFSLPYGGGVRHRLVSAPDARRVVRDVAALRDLSVGLVKGYAYPALLARAPGLRPVYVNDKPALLRMAAARRFDVAVIAELTGAWLLHELGLSEQLRVHPFVMTEGRQTQFAISRRSPRAMAALEPLNRGLARFSRADWLRFEKPYQRPLTPL